MKEASLEIAPILKCIFDFSKIHFKKYETGQLPDDWKTDKLSAINKTADKEDAANYRQVSRTFICCKIEDLSKSIYDQQQIDMAIPNFSKAFYTVSKSVSRSKSVYKLDYYGIRTKTGFNHG